MPEFYFPRKAENATQLCGSDPDIRASFGDCNGLYRNDTLKPGFAYDVSLDGLSSSRAVSRILNRPSPQQRTYLAECTAQFGQDTVTLARFHEKFLDGVDLWELGQEANSLLSSSAAVAVGRAESFKGALRDYQKALIALNKFARSVTKDAAQKAKLRNNLNKAYEQLNTKFRQELNTLIPESHRGKNKGSALTSAKRGQTLAEQPKGRRINVADLEQGKAVSRFSGALRFAGRGVAVLDGGMRIHQVHSKYQTGEDWQRELAVQTAGMSGAGVTGFATGRLVKHGLLRIGLAATPGGWLILIGSTIITGALLATQMDEKAQSMAGRAWDWMFKE
ncbi:MULTISPECIES: hypothetical protein [Halomonadaceae]|uniref:Uncharacterized protein n=1 Tax=Vreelandella halophila TaxID=86177 RepID=A0A9X4YBU4_9GAMM|nr:MULTISPECIES: hypothetical protein [Halomonas]MYL26807.1 hypothetical protein [Halomonas utahensis]MYL74068.1 hypothetical protein [Halomonas sp. 22501_18_FS]